MSENKYLLKNSGYYEILKLAKGINIGKYSTKKRSDFETGISFNHDFEMLWFKTSKGDGLFKTYDTPGAFYELKKIRQVNEVLCCELAKQIGVETAIYEPARVNGQNGVITYNVCGENETLINLIKYFDSQKHSIKSIMESLDAKKIKYDKQKMFFDLYKMMVFDLLTFQEDRHNNNMHFIVNNSDNSIRFSPLLDNEFAFGIKTMEDFYDDWSYCDLTKEKFLSRHGRNIIFFVGKGDYTIPAYNRYENNIKKLIKISKKDEMCKNFLINALEKIDIHQALQTLKEYGYDISYDYKNYIIDLIDFAKEMFGKYIKEDSDIKEEIETQNEETSFIKK